MTKTLNRAEVIKMNQSLVQFLGQFTGVRPEPLLLAGTALVVHGLRETTYDFDVAIPRHCFDSLVAQAPGKDWVVTECGGFPVLYVGYYDMGYESYASPSEVIDGVRVPTLSSLLEFKTWLSKVPDRDSTKVRQDLLDISNIERRLRDQGRALIYAV